MGESLTEQRRVNDEGLTVVKFRPHRKKLLEGSHYDVTVSMKKDLPSYVTRGYVLRRWVTRFAIT